MTKLKPTKRVRKNWEGRPLRAPAPDATQPVTLALATSLKSRLIDILERRRSLADHDPREEELLADLRRSMTASRMLDEGQLPLGTWRKLQREIRRKWIATPINVPVRICLGCMFPKP